MSANVKWSDGAGKSANGTTTAITIAATVVGMTGTITVTDVTVMITTTIDMARSVRHGGASSLVACCLLLTPYVATHAAEDQPHESAISTQARSFGAAVKHDAKAVGESCKHGAHRVAVAAKAVGHEIATAAKRGAAETRAAFGGEKAKAPVS
jgi:hypothetical protein